MTIDTGTVLFAFGLFVLLVLVYVVYRLLTDPPEPLDKRSESLGKLMGMPQFFSPIFAKRLTKREKVGWLLFFAILLLGVLFVDLTGLGAGKQWR